jgi:hypothetical protein
MKRTLLSLLMLTTIPALGQSSPGNTKPAPFAQSEQARTFALQAPDFSQLTLQGPQFGQANAEDCEVNVLHASFDRPARVMRVASQDASVIGKNRSSAAPSLSVQLKSSSNKPIASVNLLARIKLKESIYQLDSVTRSFPLTLNSTSGQQRFKLIESALGLESLTIEQVTYTDGTTWKPEHRNSCGYRSTGSILVAK